MGITFETSNDLIQYCRETIKSSPYVELDLTCIDQISNVILKANTTDWSFLLHSKSISPIDWMFDFAFNASLNGGYYYMNNQNIDKWHLNGSGSKALNAWIHDLRRDSLLPGRDIIDPCVCVQKLQPRMDGLPFAEERMKICSEFSERYRYDMLDDLVEDLLSNNIITIDFKAVNRLASIYPSGFLADPFKKKAILALIFFADYIEMKGKIINWDASLPADYQIPRILTWKGLIKISDHMGSILNSQNLLNVVSDPVMHYRCATVIVAEELAKQMNIQTRKIDGALFSLLKHKIVLPPMKVDAMWF